MEQCDGVEAVELHDLLVDEIRGDKTKKISGDQITRTFERACARRPGLFRYLGKILRRRE